MVGIVIGIASSGRKVDLRWSLSLPTLAVNAPVGMNIAWAVKEGKDRAGNREMIAEKAVELGFPYLFFLDDDTVCPNFTLKQLHYQLEQEPDAMVCGGIYCTKEDTPCPIVFKEIGGGPFWKWKSGEVFECKGLGTGAMLIKTEVFKHLSRPWFFEPHESPVDKVIAINGVEVPVMHEGGTDDLYFCKKVTDAGFTILAHGGVLPVHLDQDGKMYTLPVDSYPVKSTES
jgi:hypothetical protein